MSRPLYRYALAIVAGFLVAGVGLGMAANFTLGFYIETFVEPGTDPLDNQAVGIMLLTTMYFPFVLGPMVAGGMALAVGRALPRRRSTAAALGGAASIVGFVLLVAAALFLSFAVLAEYAPAANGDGGGSPFDPAALGSLVLQVSIPVGLVGAAGGYLGSALADLAGEGADEPDATTAPDTADLPATPKGSDAGDAPDGSRRGAAESETTGSAAASNSTGSSDGTEPLSGSETTPPDVDRDRNV